MKVLSYQQSQTASTRHPRPSLSAATPLNHDRYLWCRFWDCCRQSRLTEQLHRLRKVGLVAVVRVVCAGLAGELTNDTRQPCSSMAGLVAQVIIVVSALLAGLDSTASSVVSSRSVHAFLPAPRFILATIALTLLAVTQDRAYASLLHQSRDGRQDHSCSAHRDVSWIYRVYNRDVTAWEGVILGRTVKERLPTETDIVEYKHCIRSTGHLLLHPNDAYFCDHDAFPDLLDLK